MPVKICGITSCEDAEIAVNYGASGTNHTFYDGYPVQTDMTLTFMENELLTRDQFEDTPQGGF